jgi:hypothetical protein
MVTKVIVLKSVKGLKIFRNIIQSITQFFKESLSKNLFTDIITDFKKVIFYKIYFSYLSQKNLTFLCKNCLFIILKNDLRIARDEGFWFFRALTVVKNEPILIINFAHNNNFCKEYFFKRHAPQSKFDQKRLEFEDIYYS